MILSERVNRIKPSPTIAISTKARELKARGVDIISLSAGEPDFDTPQHIKEAGIKALEDGFTKYTAVDGIRELKDAIVSKFEHENNLTYEKDQILVSCGAKHSIYNAAQALFNDGDEVIIISPYWVSYPDIVLLNDAVPIIVPSHEKNEFKVDPMDLKRAITPRSKALILNNPCNPTGAVYSEEELKDIAEIAVDNNLVVISDEIYEKLIYDDTAFTCMASLGEDIKNITVVVNGVSKAYSMTGWRIGYAAGPKEIVSSMSKIQGQSTSNPSSISQMASTTALRDSEDAVRSMVSEFDKRRRYMVERLNSLNGISCFKPDGAFYVFPRVSPLFQLSFNGRRIDNSTRMADFLLDIARVAVVPGEAFGNDDHIRLSYATSFENIEKGLDRIEEAVMRLV